MASPSFLSTSMGPVLSPQSNTSSLVRRQAALLCLKLSTHRSRQSHSNGCRLQTMELARLVATHSTLMMVLLVPSLQSMRFKSLTRTTLDPTLSTSVQGHKARLIDSFSRSRTRSVQPLLLLEASFWQVCQTSQ